MYPAAWTQHANQTDYGHLNRHVDMLLVRYHYCTTATTQGIVFKYTPQHIYLTGPQFKHTVHKQATHRHLLQQEHVRKMDSGLDQIRLAFPL